MAVGCNKGQLERKFFPCLLEKTMKMAELVANTQVSVSRAL